MKYIVAASLFAALVSAQSIPNCALTCAITQVDKSQPDFKKDPKNCPTLPQGTNALTDTNVQKCLCKTTSFQTAFAACAKTAGCTDAEQCDLWTYSSSLCGGFGPDYALSDSLEPAQCKKSGGGGGGSSSAPPAETSAPPAETGSAPPAETTAPAQSSGAPAETSAPAQSSGAGAPPSYGSPSTVATSAAAGASGAPSTTPTFVPSSGSTLVLSGAAAVFAGLAAFLAL